MTAPPDIFLSYNREDQAMARRVAEAFQREGFSVWWDATLRSGEAYDEVTETALRTAKAVVVLWSKRSVVSRWVRAEATLADRNKTLVPAMIEPCDRPIMFELTQTADLSHWQGAPADPAWLAYVADVRRFVERAGPSTVSSAPSPTQTLTEVAAAAARSAPERGGEPNLVVLPIVSRSGVPEDGLFAEDLTSELIAELTRHGWARVITAGATDRRTAVDLRTLAQQLEARYVADAHVRRVGPTLRLMVQLLDAERGHIVWTQKYDRPLADLAAIQEALAVEVASHVGEQQILRLERERAMAKSSGWSAWERVLRVLAAAAHFSREGMRTAAAEARQALAIAPDYALAHAILAWSCGLSFSLFGSESSTDEVREHVKRAVDLASNDSRVFRLLTAGCMRIGDLQAALRFAERAVEMAPHVGNGHLTLASVYVRLGRNADAIAELDAEQALTQEDFIRYASHLYRALAHFSEGRLGEARDALDRSLKLNPNFVIAQKWKAIVSELLGRPEEARRAVQDMQATDSSLTLEEHASQIPRMLPDSGSTAEAVAMLRRVWAEVERTS